MSLLGRFTLGQHQSPREQAVEWRHPVGLGPRVDVVMPRHRPVAVRTTYELQVLAARRRRLFYPYELVSWLTERHGAASIERGRFEELELDESGTRLVPVTGRPWGENVVNLVIGLITNWSVRFPEGFTRVLIAGDPTREMGALGESECVRLIAAIDHAEQAHLPIEWVALSAGARIAFDSGTENLDWTAAVLRRIVEFTARGGVVNVIVDGPCVGAQSVLERRSDDAHALQGHPDHDAARVHGAHRQARARGVGLGGGRDQRGDRRSRDHGAQWRGAVLGAGPARGLRPAVPSLRLHLRDAR